MDIEQKQVSKNQLRAEVEIHQIPVTYVPSTVQVIKHHKDLIAVGRDNGIIQVFRDRSFVIVGHFFAAQSPVKSIIWLDDESFLSAQLSGAVNFFSLTSSLPKFTHQLPPQISIYCMAQLNQQTFVVACSDGTIKIISQDDSNKLHSSFSSQVYPDVQALSVCVVEKYVFATFSNGTIRQYQFKPPFVLQLTQTVTLALAQTAIAKQKAPIPWMVNANHQYIFIGTSHGQVHIFEREFMTEVKKLQTHHAAVLCSMVTDGVVYFSGTDSKIVQVDTETLQIIGEVRGQSNDVFAIESLPQQRLVSSGVNSDLCIYKVENNQAVYRVQGQPHKSQIQVQEFGGKRKNQKQILIALNNYSNIQLLTPNTSSESDELITLAEIQAPENIHLVRLSANCTYLLYSHQNQTVVLKLVWDQQTLSSLQKVHTFEPIIEAVFGKRQIVYILDIKGALHQIELQNQKKTFIANTSITIPSKIVILDSLLIITSINDQKAISFNIDKNYESSELSLRLADHDLQEISVIQGQNINLIAIYSNNRFSVYLHGYKKEDALIEQQWRLSQFSKQYLYSLPKNFLSFKNTVTGAVCDGLDEKRLLLFTQNSLIKAHLRGRPPAEITSLSSEGDKITLEENFTVLDLHTTIIDLIPLPRTNNKKTQILCLEWDKDQSFRDLPPAFNAKKYKQ